MPDEEAQAQKGLVVLSTLPKKDGSTAVRVKRLARGIRIYCPFALLQVVERCREVSQSQTGSEHWFYALLTSL